MDLAFTFPLVAGLHARPAAMIQEEAGNFNASIRFVNRTRGASADARSTLALVATSTAQGDECLFVFEGPDAKAALAAFHVFVDRVLAHADDGMIIAPGPSAAPSVLPRPLRGARLLSGLGVSPGVGIGPAFFLGELDQQPMEDGHASLGPEAELARFEDAVNGVDHQIDAQLKVSRSSLASDILRVHRSIVRDPSFRERVRGHVEKGGMSAEKAVLAAADDVAAVLKNSVSGYLRERAFDVQEIALRLQHTLTGRAESPAVKGPEVRSVCIARQVAASDFALLDTSKIAAFVLQRGERTSHAVILSRMAGIPAVSGVQDLDRQLAQGSRVIVDGYRGVVFPAPDEEVERFYISERRNRSEREKAVAQTALRPAVSKDGFRLEIGANCSSVADVQNAIANGAEGIGMFRTEIAFAGNENPPDEEEQTALYTSVIKCANGHPVIFRTFDVGGDKPVRWLPLPPEENPFLGYRAVRIYDEFPELINAQLRAMLRAGAHGPVHIMFPMISSVEEVRKLKEQLSLCANVLEERHVPHGVGLPVGIMVEIPSAVLQMRALCNEVDFFSVGSNDLTQYLLAIDRGNAKVRHLASDFHPALWNSFRLVIEEAHKKKKWVGICGELAGNERALPLLLGIGFNEISVGPSAIPRLKNLLRRYRKADCDAMVRSTLESATSGNVETLLDRFVIQPGLMGVIDRDLVVLTSEAESKGEIIRELLGRMEDAGRIMDGDAVEEAIWQREDTFSTGMEFGIALPHCKSPYVLMPSIAVARLQNPVSWTNGDEPVSLVILIAIPERSAADTHLKIIAALARRLMHDEFRNTLMHARSQEAIVESVLSQTREFR